jgi:cyclopropane-fatty-acyl-phospholipid synthase
MEIGTGWGSFALHAARQYSAKVTTTTISANQLVFARRRVRDEDLEALVSVVDSDYRDLVGQFDKVVSIEMVEAVGWPQQDAFFEACARLLRPGGLFVLQSIVIDDRYYEQSKYQKDFIKSVVFPGSCIPSVGSIVSSARRTGRLRLVECHDMGVHYAETLSRWRSQFLKHRAEVEALGYDDAFVRLWDFYLAYCEAGFAERRISDVQFVFEAPGTRRRRGTPAP